MTKINSQIDHVVKGMARREFVACSAIGMISFALSGCADLPCGGRTKFKLAMAGYTLKSFSADAALAFCKAHGFTHLCVKNFHLPYDATPAMIAEFRRKSADHDVTPYGVGPIYISSSDEAKKSFDYAAALGVPLIVGVPGKKTGPKWTDWHSDRALCEDCSRLADEYGIRFAIHNHGRNPKTGNPSLYPAVPETFEMLRDLSPRMGLCVDWAYTYADGLDCREIAVTYASRIFDGHIRCLSDGRNGSAGINPSGRVFGYDGIFDALRSIGYDGCLGLELANAFPNNPQWIDESRDYFKGLM